MKKKSKITLGWMDRLRHLLREKDKGKISESEVIKEIFDYGTQQEAKTLKELDEMYEKWKKITDKENKKFDKEMGLERKEPFPDRLVCPECNGEMDWDSTENLYHCDCKN